MHLLLLKPSILVFSENISAELVNARHTYIFHMRALISF